MPMEKERYPAEWYIIASAVKYNADWKCQVCGKQCRRPGEKFDTHRRTLTVAHLNHTPEDVRPENLVAMCAPCHLRYDSAIHVQHRKEKKENESGKHSMLEHPELQRNESGKYKISDAD